MDELKCETIQAPTDESIEEDSAKPCVLLVDDQPARLLTYEALLAGVGVTCVRALSGEEALHCLMRQSFALILLDVRMHGMPGMDGFGTARVMREHPRFERTPIIFVTGAEICELDTLRGYEAGAIDYISVPVVPEVLRSKVALLVELYRRRKELEGLNSILESTRAQLETARCAQQRESEARYRAIFENPMALTVVLRAVRDQAGEVVDWEYLEANRAALRVLDCTYHQLVGKRLSFALPDRAPYLMPLCLRVLTEGTPQRYEMRAGGADFVMCLFPMAEDTLVSSGFDITARLQAEQQLKDADKRKDEFIAMLAHELRNPLVPIRTAVELLKKARDQPSVVASIRPMMERQVTHMVRLIDDLLDVSRITSGRFELKRESTPLASLVGGAVDANREAIDAGGLAISVHLADSHLVLNVDPTRFAQILSNIVQNAAKFTPFGGRIAIRSTLETAAPDQPATLVIRISDTGIGIAQEMLPRIFELFAQAGAVGHGRHSGLGIGLALARRLAQMHGGTLEARSDGPGKGSEFILRVPVANDAETHNREAAGAQRSLDGVRVAVIDDNRDAADILRILIEEQGGEVCVAYDGASGLHAANGFKPEVVVLDIGLPDMDGYEACRRLREIFGRNISIIALTGWGQDRDKQRAFDAGFDAHLTKPADPLQLSDTILALKKNHRSN